MSRSVTTAAAVALLFAVGAGIAYTRAARLRTDAAWQLARGRAEAGAYVDSLDSAHAESQLETFEARRALLERAARWQRLQLFCILGALLSSFVAYLLYLYAKLREQLTEASDGLPTDSR